MFKLKLSKLFIVSLIILFSIIQMNCDDKQNHNQETGVKIDLNEKLRIVDKKNADKLKNHNVENLNKINYKKEFKSYIRNKKAKPDEKDHLQSFIQTTESPADSPKNFFGDSPYSINIYDLPEEGSAKKCWSSSYMPMRNALLAVRYPESPYSTIGVWKENVGYTTYYNYSQGRKKYSQPNEYATGPRSGDALSANIRNYYSPAEKYDVLCGDYSFTLTNWMFNFSDQYVVNNDIDTWYGLCHGWSPASYYYKRPHKGITLMAADNKTKVYFTPDDVKALASQFWAQADYDVKTSGNQCPHEDDKMIKKDSETGLYTDPLCSSIDAGDFVIIVANQMGINKRNFIIDPKPDGEVWNQPVNSYFISWYYLYDGKSYNRLHDNFIPIEDLYDSDDSFLNFVYNNSPLNTAFVVGLYIEITYTVETELNHSDRTYDDLTQTDVWRGAVRLDDNYNIINGEWSSNEHPNFVWKADEKSQPLGEFDATAPVYNQDSYVQLRSLTSYCKKASQYGQPLKTIVEFLISQTS